MSNLQLRKEVRDGIEFFVSNDGSEAGMSQAGLSVFVGVAMNSIVMLLESYDNYNKLPSETLETLRAGGLKTTTVPASHIEGGRGKDTKFIPAELCEAITYHYAFESKRVSERVQNHARKSYRKFAAIGIKTWILQITGFQSSQGNDLVPVLQHILAEMREIRQLKLRYINIKDTVKDQPGLDEMLEEYEQGYLITDGQYYTLQTWLKAKGVYLEHSEMTRLGILVGTTYKAHHRRPAPKMRGDLLGNRSDGKVNVYTAEDIPLLESALRTFRACMSA